MSVKQKQQSEMPTPPKSNWGKAEFTHWFLGSVARVGWGKDHGSQAQHTYVNAMCRVSQWYGRYRSENDSKLVTVQLPWKISNLYTMFRYAYAMFRYGYTIFRYGYTMFRYGYAINNKCTHWSGRIWRFWRTCRSIPTHNGSSVHEIKHQFVFPMLKFRESEITR